MELKEALVKAPALAYPKEGVPFSLQIAATADGISAILAQDCGTGERIIAYGSRNLSEVERRYSPVRGKFCL